MLNWTNKQDGVDEILAEDINSVANSLIETQNQISNFVIDQIYNPESEKAQSGKAVKQALDDALFYKLDKVMGSEGQYAAFDGIAPKIIPTSPDTEPTENSAKLITSGAVYEAVGNVEAALDGIIALQNSLIGGDAE